VMFVGLGGVVDIWVKLEEGFKKGIFLLILVNQLSYKIDIPIEVTIGKILMDRIKVQSTLLFVEFIVMVNSKVQSTGLYLFFCV